MVLVMATLSSAESPQKTVVPAHEEIPGSVEEAWQQIAGLRLCLMASVQFYQHVYRGKPWLIIADQNTESYFRCTADAQQFLNLLDGSRSVEQALSEANESLEHPMAQHDIVMLLANLKQSYLLQDEHTMSSDTAAVSQRKTNSWLRPFSIRFALIDPDVFLENTVKYIRPLLSPATLWLWWVLVIIALIASMMNWNELVEHGQARFNDPKNLLWYWLLYAIVKMLHELGHAYTTKAWGGAVNEMGIMLLVFFPVPYVDSSAANRIVSKNKRMLVSAAGIMVEMLLASLSLLLWTQTQPGLLHDLAFDIVMIGGLSTLIFNANPLLRFDGYYIFSEFIEIPNLGTRSIQYLGYLFKRYLLGIEGTVSPVTAYGEKKWLFIYGICAGFYRVFISLFIAFWVAGKFLIIGISLAIWAIFTQILYPIICWLTRLIPLVRSAQRKMRLALIASIVSLIVFTGLIVPIGHSTYAEGIINLPENALIRAGADGIVKRLLVVDGAEVTTGITILELENLELATRHDILLAKHEEALVRQKQAMLLDRTEAENFKAKVFAIEAEITDVKEQLKNLLVTSSSKGFVSLPMAIDLPGKYVKRGDVIGYIADLRQVSARVVIPQAAIEAVRNDTQFIYARLSSRPGETVSANYLRELPQATDQLPSRLLGSGAGGEVAVDFRDDSGVQAISNIFQMEISLPMRDSGSYLGQRIYVRFIHQRESLGVQLLHKLNQVFLQAPFI